MVLLTTESELKMPDFKQKIKVFNAGFWFGIV